MESQLLQAFASVPIEVRELPGAGRSVFLARNRTPSSHGAWPALQQSGSSSSTCEFRVPPRAVLRSEEARHSLPRALQLSCDEDTALALAASRYITCSHLYKEDIDPISKYAPTRPLWMATWPEPGAWTAVAWSESELAALRGTHVGGLAAALRRQTRSDFDRLRETAASHACTGSNLPPCLLMISAEKGYEIFCTALGGVLSRKYSTERGVCLAAGIDLLNHSSSAESEAYWEDDELVVAVHVDHTDSCLGTEILANYGDLSAEESFVAYGFASGSARISVTRGSEQVDLYEAVEHLERVAERHRSTPLPPSVHALLRVVRDLLAATIASVETLRLPAPGVRQGFRSIALRTLAAEERALLECERRLLALCE